MLDEKWLVWRSKRGSGEALTEIYRQYRDEVMSLALAMTGNRATAEDVVQDVFVGFAEHLGKLALRTSLQGYLLRSAANRVRNLWRARAEQTAALEAEPAGREKDWPDEAMISAETASCIRQAMDRLPAEQREAIVLRLEAEMTFKEIAEIQEASIATVNSRYRYGLEKLRTLLNGRVEI